MGPEQNQAPLVQRLLWFVALWLCGVVAVWEPGVGVAAGVDAGAAALLVLPWLPPPEDAAMTISSRTKPTPASAVSLRRR